MVPPHSSLRLSKPNGISARCPSSIKFMKIPPVSIIIPTLNEEGYLPLLLESLKKVATPLDIIVVDGNSTDNTHTVVESFESDFSGDSSLRLIFLKERCISLQRNIGAQQAKYDLLIFCDADILMPSADVYEQMISEFIEKKYVVAAPVMIPIEDLRDVQRIFKFLMFVQKALLILKRPYFAGSYLLTTKDVFTKLGGFDTKIRLGEDVDYSLRASKLGSYGFRSTPILVSARILIKYGYGWIFRETPNMFRLLFTGHVHAEKMFYPFGDFGKPYSSK